MSRAENSERGELLLEVRERPLHRGWFGRVIHTIFGLCILGSVLALLRDSSLGMGMFIGLAVLFVLDVILFVAEYNEKDTFRFYTQGVEAAEIGVFYPWEEFRGYKVNGEEVVLLAATETSKGKNGVNNKGLFEKLLDKIGKEDFCFSDCDYRIRSITARYLPRL